MNRHIIYALAHPVYNPEEQINEQHGWIEGPLSYMLTVNIGME